MSSSPVPSTVDTPVDVSNLTYCFFRPLLTGVGLPPLTILVVRQDTGMPGVGFIAAQDIPKTQVEVFAYDWLGHGCSKVEEFVDAARKHPSNGLRPSIEND